MRKILTLCGAVLLILSLVGNVYLFNKPNGARTTVDRNVSNAVSLLQSAATMKIIPNSQNNTPETRALMIGEAGAYLDACVPSLSKLGIHNMDKLGSTVKGIAFPMMFPTMLGVNQAQMLTFVKKITHLLESCERNNSVDLEKLQNVIDSSVQAIPGQMKLLLPSS